MLRPYSNYFCVDIRAIAVYYTLRVETGYHVQYVAQYAVKLLSITTEPMTYSSKGVLQCSGLIQYQWQETFFIMDQFTDHFAYVPHFGITL